MTAREKTVSALAYTLGGERAGDDPRLAAPYNDLARWTEAELRRLPDFLRPAVAALTLLFDAAGLAHAGALFHRQTPERRLRQVRAWRGSRLGVCRDFIRLYEGLSLLALHSR